MAWMLPARLQEHYILWQAAHRVTDVLRDLLGHVALHQLALHVNQRGGLRVYEQGMNNRMCMNKV